MGWPKRATPFYSAGPGLPIRPFLTKSCKILQTSAKTCKRMTGNAGLRDRLFEKGVDWLMSNRDLRTAALFPTVERERTESFSSQ